MRLLIIALLLASSAFAADVDGKWTGSLSTPLGDLAVAFTFKADGDTLNGTTEGPDGVPFKIAEGKVDGNNITFTATFDYAGRTIVFKYKGVVTKDEIKFKVDAMGTPVELTVKKGG
jgi:hypothetical protein